MKNFWLKKTINKPKTVIIMENNIVKDGDSKLFLPYKDVKDEKDPIFWNKYWDRYNSENNHIIEDSLENGCFKPNPEQEYVLSLIRDGKNIFINSPAGTGKSALLKYFCFENKSNKSIGLTSTTGISALNINGSTLHSFLGIGLGNDNLEDLYEKIMKIPEKRLLWLKLDILIVDEISMLHPDLFNKLEKMARSIRENDLKFGGIQLVLSGDLFQLPCVSKNSALITGSRRFKKCIDHVVELRNIIRQKDRVFKTVLNKVRVGTIDDETKSILESRFLKFKPSLETNIKPTNLFCTRRSVDHLNEKELNKLSRKGHEFREYSMEFVKVECPISFDYIVKNFIKNSTTPETLQICEETQVMLTFNISPHLVNGSRGIVVGFTDENYPIVEFLNGGSATIAPIKFDLTYTSRSGKIQKVGYAKQIPLKIAYALTIHSSQGSTLDCVSIDLRECFEYGQAYTALSRVKSMEGLFLKKFDFEVIKAHPEALKFLKI